jgi:hypothetical protein
VIAGGGARRAGVTRVNRLGIAERTKPARGGEMAGPESTEVHHGQVTHGYFYRLRAINNALGCGR